MASYEYKDGELNRIAGGVLYADSPIGSIIPYGGTVAPRGWFICDGSALNRVTYAELFAVIGTSYGAGDGSTTFNIPNKPETIGCNIIKAQQIGVPADFAPVDTVALNNMQSVTSNAVADIIKKLLPNYANRINIQSDPWTATQDCYCVYTITGVIEHPLYIDDIVVSCSNSHNGVYIDTFSGFIRKGQVVKSISTYVSDFGLFKAFPLKQDIF